MYSVVTCRFLFGPDKVSARRYCISTVEGKFIVSVSSLLQRKIMPLRIAVACATRYNNVTCQSDEKRKSRPMYTVARVQSCLYGGAKCSTF